MWILGVKRGKFSHTFSVGTSFSSHTTCDIALGANCIYSFTKMYRQKCFALLSCVRECEICLAYLLKRF
jgi:hypothetical protein